MERHGLSQQRSYDTYRKNESAGVRSHGIDAIPLRKQIYILFLVLWRMKRGLWRLLTCIDEHSRPRTDYGPSKLLQFRPERSC